MEPKLKRAANSYVNGDGREQTHVQDTTHHSKVVVTDERIIRARPIPQAGEQSAFNRSDQDGIVQRQ